jgi:hypothetical protein
MKKKSKRHAMMTGIIKQAFFDDEMVHIYRKVRGSLSFSKGAAAVRLSVCAAAARRPRRRFIFVTKA